MRWRRRSRDAAQVQVVDAIRGVARHIGEAAYQSQMQTNTALQMLARAIADASCRDKQFAMPASFVESFRDGGMVHLDLGPVMHNRDDQQAIETLRVSRNGSELWLRFVRRNGDPVQTLQFVMPTPTAGP